MVVRDAVDLVRACVLHSLSLGLERLLIVDNGSTDGTQAVLARLARRHPVRWTVHQRRFRMDEVVTSLVHDAARLGADWVVPIDVDEFWWVKGRLPELLGHVQRDGVLVEVANFVQRREQLDRSPRALLTMTTRAPRAADPVTSIELARSGRIAIVEGAWRDKVIVRASAEVLMEWGSHGASGLGDFEYTDRIEILHAPFPARQALELRAGRADLRDDRLGGAMGWQHHLIVDAVRDGGLEELWRANSAQDGHLDVGGERHPVVSDDRLRQAARPHVRRTWPWR